MILRICVVIHSYDNSRTISEVVKDVVTRTPFPVLIVDDGSEAQVSNVLYSWEVRHAIAEGRVRVERFAKHRGRLAAAQVAVQKLVAEGFTHILTMSAAGDDSAAEIHKLVELGKLHPWDLIVGDRGPREAEEPPAPSQNHLAKWKTRFQHLLESYQAGQHIHDPQSGFRLYPLFVLQTRLQLRPTENFELAMLLRLLWHGVGVREVRVDSQHLALPAEARVGGYLQNVWRRLKLSTLRSSVFLLLLLKSQVSPKDLALALGLGVFIGCTPFFGFHTLIIMVVAVALRANLPVMWVGSHVSTPVLAPFLYYYEKWVGEHWLHVARSDEGHGGAFYQWLAGSVVVGLVLSALAMTVTYLLAWRMQKRREHAGPVEFPRSAPLPLGFLLRHLRPQGLVFLAKVMAVWSFVFSPGARRGLSEYLKISAPELRWKSRQRRLLQMFFSYWQIQLERRLHVERESWELAAQSEGLEQARTLMARESGAVFLSAHVGHWPLAAVLSAPELFTDRVLIAAPAASGFILQKISQALRDVSSLGSANLESDLALNLYSALENGAQVFLPLDRPHGDRFELVPFLGNLIPVDVSLFRLLVARQIPAVFSFGLRGASGIYKLVVHPPQTFQFTSPQGEETQAREWAGAFAIQLEKVVKLYPDQWFNFFPIWSKIPRNVDGGIACQTGNSIYEDLGPLSQLKPVAPDDLNKNP